MVLALMDFTVQWQRLMSLLAIMAQEQCPETEYTGTVALQSGEKPGGLPGGSDVLAEI